MSFDAATLVAAHGHCSAHREELRASDICGCFYCVSTYSPTQIGEWLEETGGELSKRPDPWTALCPECGIDAVIGIKSGYPVGDVAFLKAMNKEWFNEDDA
jgi:hypothetical protein